MIAAFLRRAIAIAPLACAAAACSGDGADDGPGGIVLDEPFEYRFNVITGEGDIGPVPLGSRGVINVTRLEIREGATLRIIGGAVALLVDGDAIIDGRIRFEFGGRNDPGCGPNNERIIGDTCGGGSGGGGSQPGAMGGTCTVDGVVHRGGESVAVVSRAIYDDLIFGGCAGGPGAPNPIAEEAPGGFPGAGGGGLRIAAGDIRIGPTALLDVNGEGGQGGQSFDGAPAGGGGGGAGGSILLEADHIGIEGGARLCANGGAGGAGSAQPDGRIAGANGERGHCEDASAGGNGPGANGGNGGATFPPTPGTNGTGDTASTTAQGGGGGGGAAGQILLRSSDTAIAATAVISPAPQLDF